MLNRSEDAGPSPLSTPRRRMSDAHDVVERIANYCESGEVDKATLACLRLARLVGDTYSVVLFLRELYPDRKQLNSTFDDETDHLKEEARNFVWKNTLEHWSAERTLDFSLDPTEPDSKLVLSGVGELQRLVVQLESAIQDLRLPSGMGEFDTAAFTDRNQEIKRLSRLQIRAASIVLERVRTRCMTYATRIERQLRAQESATNLVASLQSEVHNYYANRSDQAYQSIRRAAELLKSSEPEDHALLLTSIRRAVKAVSDYHYPPVATGEVICSDGKPRVLGDEQYLNRLEEFIRSTFGGDTSSRLLRAELDYSLVFMRRLNEIASKGVHSEVTHAEARQGLLGLYIFLSNMIIKLEHSDSATEL